MGGFRLRLEIRPMFDEQRLEHFQLLIAGARLRASRKMKRIRWLGVVPGCRNVRSAKARAAST